MYRTQTVYNLFLVQLVSSNSDAQLTTHELWSWGGGCASLHRDVHTTYLVKNIIYWFFI